ncbi:hypothetical protein [Parafilimonas terrae]|nr:hypothetical protein [Parafilimonas terrae]
MPEIEISTVRDENWLGVKNGMLIQMALKHGFSVFITNDHNLLHFQQKLAVLNILFINLNLPSNRYEELLPVILILKEWLLKNKENISDLISTKNYLVYPNGFLSDQP